MATVNGYTAERMKEIEDNTIVDADIVGNDLILTRFDGTTFNAGEVRGAPGPTGPTGPAGATSITICTSGTRPGAPTNGMTIYETDTKRQWTYDGTAWRWHIGTGTSPYAIRLHPGANQAIAAGTSVNVAWSEALDRPGAFATPTITIPVTGTWRFTGAMRVSSSSTGTWDMILDLLLAGALFSRLGEQYFESIASGSSISLPISYENEFAAGDLIRFSAHSGGIGATIQSPHFSTHLAVDLVGY